MIIKIPWIALVIFFTVAWIVFRIRAYKRTGTNFRKEIGMTLLYLYLLGVFYFTMSPFSFTFPLPFLFSGHLSVDTQLFHELGKLSDWKRKLYYSGGNILMTIPFGIIVPFIWPKLRSIWKVTLLGFCFSLCIETTQLLFTLTRNATVDDLFFNTIGACIGIVVFKILTRDNKNKSLRA